MTLTQEKMEAYGNLLVIVAGSFIAGTSLIHYIAKSSFENYMNQAEEIIKQEAYYKTQNSGFVTFEELPDNAKKTIEDKLDLYKPPGFKE